MQFATSFCNGPVLASMLKRQWPLMVAVLAVVIILPGLQILGLDQADFGSYDLSFDAHVRQVVFGVGTVMLAGISGASIIAALLTYRHLHSRREIQFHRALPMTRTCAFITSCITGFLLMALPFVVGIVVDMAFSAVVGAHAAIPALGQLALAGLGTMLCMYGLAVLSCVAAGSTVGSILIYGAINGALGIIFALGQTPFEMIMVGIGASSIFSSWVTWLMPVYRLAEALVPHFEYSSAGDYYMLADVSGFSSPATIGIYALVGVALLALGWALYRARRDETAGDTVAFGPVEVVCKVFAGLIVAVFGASVVFSIGTTPTWVPFVAVAACLLVFAFIGWIIAEMVARQTLRVFNRRMLLGAAIMLVCLAAGLGVMRADVGGRVAYVPDADDVESARVQGPYFGSIVASPEDAIEVHEYALAHRDALVNVDSGATSTTYVIYTLKDGTRIERHYMEPWNGDYEPTGAVFQHAREVLDKPEYVYQTQFEYGAPDITAATLVRAGIERYSDDDDGAYADVMTESTILTTEQGLELYQAICEDIDAGRLSLATESRGMTRVYSYAEFTWMGESYDFGLQGAPRYGHSNTYSASIPIYDQMTSTCAWLDANLD